MTLALSCSPPSAGQGEPSPYPHDKGQDLLNLSRAATKRYLGYTDEDIAQTVALQSLKAFSTLVYRVAQNRCADHLRLNSRVARRSISATGNTDKTEYIKRVPEPKEDSPPIRGRTKLAYSPHQRKKIQELREHFDNARAAAGWLKDHPRQAAKLFKGRIPDHTTIYRIWKEWEKANSPH